jgi:hypothetical protein
VRDSINFHPVKTMDEVLKLALRGATVAVPVQRRSRKAQRNGAEAAVSAH